MYTTNKKIKQLTSILIAITLVFTSLQTYTIKAQAETTSTWSGSTVTSWYDASEDYFEISTAEQLAGLASLVNSGTSFSGKTVVLTDDIDLGGLDWSPIGTISGSVESYTYYPFEGVFDGGNYTISNLYINASNSSYQGLFGFVKNGTIKNVNVSGDVTGSSYTAGIVGYIAGETADITVDNCSFEGTLSGSSCIGGIVGYAVCTTVNLRNPEQTATDYTITITNCTNNSTILGSDNNVGGIVGYVGVCLSCEVSNCYNSGKITSSNSYGDRVYMGGIIGKIVSSCTVDNCTNAGDIVAGGYTGGIIGEIDAQNDSLERVITNCTNTGNITSTYTGDSYLGGILGRFVTGVNDDPSLTVDGCYNTGDIIGGGDEVGGILGSIQNGSVGVSNCFSEGDIDGGADVGGIVGSVTTSNVEVTDSYYNKDAVTDTSVLTSLNDGTGLDASTYAVKLSAYLDSLRSDATITVTMDGWVYGSSASTPAYTTDSDGSDVTYIYYADEDCTKEVEDIEEALAGTYYVIATIAETNNYRASTSLPVAFTIEDKVEQEIGTSGDVNVSIDEETKQQLLDELFSNEEIAQNKEMKVTVQVDITTSGTMSSDEQALFDAFLSSYNEDLALQELVASQTLIMDISLFRTFGDEVTTITNLITPITITITIPEEFQNDDGTFFILRNHEGVITLLEDEDDDPTTVTFTTDCFSIYTLNYITEDASTSAVETSDQMNPQMMVVLLVVSRLGILAIIEKKDRIKIME